MQRLTLSRAVTCALARRAVTCALALAAVCAAAPRAAAQSNSRGPGPITDVRVTEKGLVFAVAGGRQGAALFAGKPRVSVASGAGWVPFDDRAVVQKGGARLLQTGTVGGLSIDEAFPDGEQRRIAIRNGDGAVTEIDVLRLASGFFLPAQNRAPGALVRRQGPAVMEGLAVRANRQVDLTLPASDEPPGYDAVVEVSLPPLPEGANDEYVSLTATDVATNLPYSSEVFFPGNGLTRYLHTLLPEGEYRFSVRRTFSYGNRELYFGQYLVSEEVPGTFRVSRDSRLFAVSLEEVRMPPLASASLTVEGLDQFGPSAANRLEVTVSLTSRDYEIQFGASREVGAPGPLSLEVRVPEGEYAAWLSVGTPLEFGPGSSAAHSQGVALGTVAVAPEMTLSVPPLVRITGALLDPGFSLTTSSDPAGGGFAYQYVGATAVGPGFQNFNASAYLLGFARSYSMFVPRGSSGRVYAQLAVKLGADGGRPGRAKSRVGRLEIDMAAPELVFDSDRTVDVTAPALPQVVTVTGRVVDASGRPVSLAIVSASGSQVEGLEGTPFSTSAATNRRGEFTLLVPRGAGYRISAYSYDSPLSPDF